MCSNIPSCSSSRLTDGEHRGRGEAAGIYYIGDDVAAHDGAARAASRCDRELREPRGAAFAAAGRRRPQRCRLRDVGARSLPRRQAGLETGWPRRGAAARHHLHGRRRRAGEDGRRTRATMPAQQRIKIKLTGELDLDIARVPAVRDARPERLARRRREPGLLDRRARPPGRGHRRAEGFAARAAARARTRESDLDGYRERDPARGGRKRARP